MPGRTSRNAKIYVANIRDALIAADPAGRAAYEANAAAYLAKLDALDAEIRACRRHPADRRRIITSHDAFRYFEEAYGHRLRRAAGRLDRDGGLGQGRGPDHPADQAREDPGGVRGERLGPPAHGAHRQGDRRQDRRPRLFGRALGPGRPGRHLH